MEPPFRQSLLGGIGETGALLRQNPLVDLFRVGNGGAYQTAGFAAFSDEVFVSRITLA